MTRPKPCAILLTLAGLAACNSPSDSDGEVLTTCGPSNTMTLAVGEATSLTPTGARFFCVSSGEASAEFVVVAFAATTADLSVTARTDNTVPAEGPPSPVSVAAVADGDPRRLPSFTSPVRGAVPMPDDRFHYELRERELRELTPLVRGTGRGEDRLRTTRASGPEPSLAWVAEPVPARAAPSVGDVLSFNTQAESGKSCSSPITVAARVWGVSERAIVAADVGNPPGGFGAGDYLHYAATFDTLIAPIADRNFGAPSDIDDNERTILLFTQEVNRLTPANSGVFTAGFFFSRDLFPKQATPGGNLDSCPASNEAEILYLMVPDPTGQVNGNQKTKEFVQSLTLSTILHEDQHLVNAARRLYVQKLDGSDWSEEVWLNEGLSHAAEELLFYETSAVGPGQNVTYDALTNAGDPTVVAFNNHQLFNLLRFHEHLAAPSTSSAFDPTDALPARGASWSFLRYAADRRGGDQPGFFHALVNSPTRGTANLGAVLGNVATMFDWMTDWSVAVYADDRVTNLASRHQDVSWNHPNLYSALAGSQASFPIQTVSLPPEVSRTQQLIGGGTAYFRLGVAAGQEGEVEITSGGGTPPETLRVTLLRTR